MVLDVEKNLSREKYLTGFYLIFVAFDVIAMEWSTEVIFLWK